MLKFKIQDKEGLYLALLSPRTKIAELDALLETLGEDWKREAKTKTGKRSLETASFPAGDILVPAPLKDIHPFFYSNGAYYSGNVQIYTCDLAETGKFEKTMENGLNALANLEGAVRTGNGVLILNESVPLFGATLSYPALNLFFGKDGTKKRDLRNQEQFEADIDLFLNNLEVCVNGCCSNSTPDITYSIF